MRHLDQANTQARIMSEGLKPPMPPLFSLASLVQQETDRPRLVSPWRGPCRLT